MAGTEHVDSMEGFNWRKDIRIEAGETSNGAATEEAQTQSNSIHSISLAERLKMVMDAGKNARNQSSTPKIQKVIFLLRDHKDFMKYYEPRVVSLGPIHHGKPKYKLGEKYKLVLTYEFMAGNYNTMEEAFNKIKEKIKELRECFEEEVTKEYDDEALTWLLFVDSCAILQFIHCDTKNKFDDLSIKTDSVTFCHQDLFLLENQLPYRLLKWLMSLKKMDNELTKSIETFIKGHVEVTPPKEKFTILRCAWLSSLSWKITQRCKQPQEQKNSVHPDPIHLLDLLRTRLLDNHQQPNQTKLKQNWQSYRNVQELRAAGIHLKCSNNSCLSNISFSRRCLCFGYLSLPPITVDDSTRPKFLNLIAYEMCLDFKNNFEITSYISFLDSLIDEANDVKELRKARVLYNFLGSDEEVAQLFNEIGTDLVPNPETYKDVKHQIQEYYDNKCMTWIAQVIHDHFSSPWTILAFCGVLLGLGLTAAQTWYAVDSSRPGPCDHLCKNLTQKLHMLKLKFY